MMVESVEMTRFGAIAAGGSTMPGAGVAVEERPAGSRVLLPSQGGRRAAVTAVERARGRRLAGPVECPASAPERGYRMGRWERLGMTVVVAAALVVGLVTFFKPADPGREIVVGPGDSMLSVVLREMPEVDPARAAELIEAANGLADGTLAPGMVLSIPTAP